MIDIDTTGPGAPVIRVLTKGALPNGGAFVYLSLTAMIGSTVHSAFVGMSEAEARSLFKDVIIDAAIELGNASFRFDREAAE